MKQSVRLDDFLNFNFLSALSFSPDGSRCGFLVNSFDLPKDGYKSQFYTYTESGEFKALAEGVSAYCWIDDCHVVFPAARGSEEKSYREKGGFVSGFYSLDIRSGSTVKLFSLPLNANEIKFHRDRYIFSAVTAKNRPDVERMNTEEVERTLAALKKEEDYQIFEEVPFWMNGKGIVSGTRNAIFTCMADGSGLTRLSPDTVEAAGFFPHDNGVAVFGPDYEHYRQNKEVLYHIPFNGGEAKLLIANGRFSIKNACSFGKHIMVAASDHKRFGASENPCFYLVDEGGNMELISDPDISVSNGVATDCRYGGGNIFKTEMGKLYFVSTVGHDSCLCAMDEKGNLEIFQEQGSVDCFDTYGDKIAAICMKGLRLEELYFGKTSGKLKIASDFNEKFFIERDMSEPEHFSFTNTDGVEIDGWIIKPCGFDTSKKYPAILDMHGGPKAVYGSVYYHEMQVWAARGYVVFFCNPRGSDGKGNIFARVDGKFGSIDYDDFMQFTDAVLARAPYIDKSRLGLTGGSYGGYLTNYIITQTDRFAAAVAQRSVSSWLTTIFTCDGGFHLAEDQLDGAKIWDEKSWEKFWKMSPIRYADKVKTPTLFLHSEHDYRTWIVEGIMMYSALIYHGVPARMHVFKGENHNLSRAGRPSHRARRIEEIVGWFERYLKR